jgi:hypothetical protein
VFPEVLLIRDDGSGGCTYATAADPLDQISAYQPCTTLFPGPCASYEGYLTLVVAYDGGGTYEQPDFQSHLTTIGLGDVTSLYALDLYVIQLPPNGDIPTDIQLAFLPGLSRITYTLIIIECTEEDPVKGGCPIVTNPPSTPRLVAIPALSKVSTFRELIIQSTALKDMMSFTGLTCSPTVMTVVNNLGLATLQGLENLRPWSGDPRGPFVTFVQNALTTPASVSALQTMALCDQNGDSGLSGGITMDVSDCPNGLQLQLQVSPSTYFTSVGR